jgi:hypothetical protein
VRLESTLVAWILKTRRAADAQRVAQTVYESGDAPNVAFRQLLHLPEASDRFIIPATLFEQGSDGVERLTLLGMAAWIEVHTRFVYGEGDLADAARRRMFIPPA